jgi:hypothetical protein
MAIGDCTCSYPGLILAGAAAMSHWSISLERWARFVVECVSDHGTGSGEAIVHSVLLHIPGWLRRCMDGSLNLDVEAFWSGGSTRGGRDRVMARYDRPLSGVASTAAQAPERRARNRCVVCHPHWEMFVTHGRSTGRGEAGKESVSPPAEPGTLCPPFDVYAERKEPRAETL